MQIYLVGGAVRDGLLKRPVKDRDWVVVGATPEQLLALGYEQVGADFPVFLHPKTREEYALARTERKSGQGYQGFECRFSPDVTLEQDLLRRDLTINAMAQDEQGNIVDPYGGRADLEQKILRHVSPAFAEDPLRVLRVARFAARFAPLGFTIAPETLALMQHMVSAGELDHLVAELRRKHALKGSNPKRKPSRKKNDPKVLYWPRSGRLRRSIADLMVGRRFSNLESHYKGLCRQLRQERDLLKSILALVETEPNR